MSKQHMAIDQNGTTYHDLGPHPRKGLMDEFGLKSARRIYMDDKAGKTHHVGWVVGQHWCNVFEVIPMRRPA